MARIDVGHRTASVIPVLSTFFSLSLTVLGWGLLSGHQSRFFALSAMLSFIVMLSRGLFRTTMVPDLTSRVLRTISSVISGVLLSLAAVFFLAIAKVDDDTFLLALGVLSACSIIGLGVGLSILRSVWSKGLGRSRALIVGDSELSREIQIETELRPTYGVDVVGFLSPFPEVGVRSVVSPILGSLDDLETVLAATKADRVILAPAGARDAELVPVARRANALGIPVFVVPRLFELGIGMDSLSPDRVRGYPLVRVQRSAHPWVALRLKRLFDVVLAAIGIVVSLPVVLIAAIAVKVTSRGPVLFAQQRVGHRGIFVVRKLRSMREATDDCEDWTAAARVTRVGAILRGTGIDELPQLINILRGDMSFVGPRPERPVFVDQFREVFENYDERLRMPAGLTGLSQIGGLRGDTSIAERLKYDNLYIDQWSFSGDIQILFKTAWAILRSAKYEQSQRQLASAISDGTEGGATDELLALRRELLEARG